MRKRLDKKRENRNKLLSNALIATESSLCTFLNCNHNYISKINDTKWFKHVNDNDIAEFDESDCLAFQQIQIIDDEYWDTIPIDIDPSSGELNELRAYRKRSQVMSLIILIEEELKHRKESIPIVVDFGAGSGHLSLLLAYRNPNIKVILVERKEYSIINARLRINKCKLSNVEIYLNDARDILSSGYLKKFDIGTSLHSCGQLTDIALYLSIQSYASLVLTPCCYGQITKPPPSFQIDSNINNTIANNTINNNMLFDDVNKSIIDDLSLSKYPLLQTIHACKINQFHVLLTNKNDLITDDINNHLHNDINNNDIKIYNKTLLNTSYNLSDSIINKEEYFKAIVSGADYATHFAESTTSTSTNTNNHSGNNDNMHEILSESFMLAKRCMRLVDFDRCLHILKLIKEYHNNNNKNSNSINNDNNSNNNNSINNDNNNDYSNTNSSNNNNLMKEQVKPSYYKFRIASLRPLECSPKNNVIIGRFCND